MSNLVQLPLIFDIKRCSLDDGEGIRTTIFLKGCPLKCRWCHNPESYESLSEISFTTGRCIGCGKCKKACFNEAINLQSDERIERYLCRKCASCVRVCPSLALEEIGIHYPLKQLLEIVMRDEEYYRSSGGGVTFSGGEPLLHVDYVSEAARMLNDRGVSIAVQTCGFFDYDSFREKVLPYIRDIYFDIKLMDSKLHMQYTGADNFMILENFKRLIREPSIHIVPRTPKIPGITDTPDNLASIRDFLLENGIKDHVLLPYNDGGMLKSRRIGQVKEQAI
ncbi:MAG TPA: glycyl-radical enzyme activating protein [Clostridia bacterium]